MRVAFCSGFGNEKDGIADYSLRLSGELKKTGIEIMPFGLRHYYGQRGFYRLLAEGVNKNDLCHIQYNYVYFNGDLPYHNRFVYFARLIKIPLVVTIHEIRTVFNPSHFGFSGKCKEWVYNHSLGLLNLWNFNYHKKMFSLIDKIIVHTSRHQSLINSFIRQKEKVLLLPHGVVEVSLQDRQIDPESAKRELGLAGKTVLAFFGFINAVKGYELVLDILPRLPGNVVLLIAGGKMKDNEVDNAYFNSLTNRISSLKLVDKVRIMGYLEENKIPLVMAATDICLAPYSPLVIWGSGSLSMQIGFRKPIIASDIEAHMEINKRIPCLETFRQGDVQDLLAKTINLLNDKKRKAELVELADVYSRQFGYSKIADNLNEVYRQVLLIRK